MDQDSREQYQHFLLHSNVTTEPVRVPGGRDSFGWSAWSTGSHDGLSSVYAFFDPSGPGASYGTYNVLLADRALPAARLAVPRTSATGSPRAARWPTRRASRPIEGLGEGVEVTWGLPAGSDRRLPAQFTSLMRDLEFPRRLHWLASCRASPGPASGPRPHGATMSVTDALRSYRSEWSAPRMV